MGFPYPKDMNGNEIYLGDHIQDSSGKFLGTVEKVTYDNDDENPLLEYKSLAYNYGHLKEVRSMDVKRLDFPCIEEVIMQALTEEFQNMRELIQLKPENKAYEYARTYKPRLETAKRYAEIIETACLPN